LNGIPNTLETFKNRLRPLFSTLIRSSKPLLLPSLMKKKFVSSWNWKTFSRKKRSSGDQNPEKPG
jgi:hypothetical protein